MDVAIRVINVSDTFVVGFLYRLYTCSCGYMETMMMLDIKVSKIRRNAYNIENTPPVNPYLVL